MDGVSRREPVEIVHKTLSINTLLLFQESAENEKGDAVRKEQEI